MPATIILLIGPFPNWYTSSGLPVTEKPITCGWGSVGVGEGGMGLGVLVGEGGRGVFVGGSGDGVAVGTSVTGVAGDGSVGGSL